MLDNLRYFTYTHTNMYDVWDAYFGQLKKHSPEVKHTVMINKMSTGIPVHQVEYDEDHNYCQQYINCLNEIDEDYIIYMQEDFYLYRDINPYKMKEYLDIIESDNDVSFVRLCKQPFFSLYRYSQQQIDHWKSLGQLEVFTADDVSEVEYNDTLYWVKPPREKYTSNLSYSMQPTIWNKEDLIRLYEKCNRHSFGEGADWTDALNDLNIRGLYHYNNEPQRGLLHFDSSVFPYVLTAIVKGYWNTMEYPELVDIINAYRIDPLTRGELNPSNMHGQSWHQG